MEQVKNLIKDTLESYNNTRKCVVNTITKLVENNDDKIVLSKPYAFYIEDELHYVRYLYIENGLLYVAYEDSWNCFDKEINKVGFDTDTMVDLMGYLV